MKMPDGFRPGQILSHYCIVDLIGSGGMGDIYLAEDQTLKRNVALKLLRYQSDKDRGAEFDFRLEAQAAAGLNHPNIITIYEIFDYSGYPVIAME
jgi:serine/threonine protein kinase